LEGIEVLEPRFGPGVIFGHVRVSGIEYTLPLFLETFKLGVEILEMREGLGYFL
jgi:hypothetical protein